MGTDNNAAVRFVVVSLLVLLVIPLMIALGMMAFGASMMAQMTGMMGSAGFIALCVLWAVLVLAALVTLIVLSTRGRHRMPSERTPQSH